MKLTNVAVLLNPADSTTWTAMKQVVSSCRAAGVAVPADVVAFFGGDVDAVADCKVVSKGFTVTAGVRAQEQIIVVDLTSLPPGSRTLQITVES